MQVSLRLDGVLDPRKLQAFTLAQQRRIRRGVLEGMRGAGPRLRDAARADAARAFRGKTQAARSFGWKLFASKPDRLPALKIGSRIPWLGIHETGGVIRGPLLIPLGGKRPRNFRKTVAALLRQGNAHFARVKGRTLLFAENIPESQRLTAGFRRQFSKAVRGRGGGGRIKRGADIPIAVLVSRVTVRKRLQFEGTVRRGVPPMVIEIERAIGRQRG
jgi:hypothetical protein